MGFAAYLFAIALPTAKAFDASVSPSTGFGGATTWWLRNDFLRLQERIRHVARMHVASRLYPVRRLHLELRQIQL